LRDVPEGHWANDAVYQMVRLGVTGGFPDGTYHGDRAINRFEISSFLSKLNRSYLKQSAYNKKIVEELKSEVALLTYNESPQSGKVGFFGSFEGRFRQSFSPSVTQADYRLKLSASKLIDRETALKINLDTMDTGYNIQGVRDISTTLFDAKGTTRLWGMDLSMVLGPGKQLHTEPAGMFPSENNIYYMRPNSALELSGAAKGFTLSSAFVARQVTPSGEVGVQELNAKLAYVFGKWLVYLQPHYVFGNDSHDYRAETGLVFTPSDKMMTNLVLALGSSHNTVSGLYAKFEQKMLDPRKTGTQITLRIDAVGSNYRKENLDKYEFLDVNNFDRLFLDGTIDVGLSLKQKLYREFFLEFKSDWVTDTRLRYGENYPGTYLEWEGALGYSFAKDSNLNLFYRSYNVPSGIAQFADLVPVVSSLVGLSVKCGF